MLPNVKKDIQSKKHDEIRKLVIVSVSTAREAKRAVKFLSRDLTYNNVEYVVIVGPPLLEGLPQLNDFLIFDHFNILPGSKKDVSIYSFHPYSPKSWKKCAKNVFKQASLKNVHSTLISQDNGLITAFSLSVIGLLTYFNEVSVNNAVLLSDPLFPAPINYKRLPQSKKKRKILRLADTGIAVQELITEVGNIAYDYTNSLAEKGLLVKRNGSNGVRAILLPKGKVWVAFLEVKQELENGTDRE